MVDATHPIERRGDLTWLGLGGRGGLTRRTEARVDGGELGEQRRGSRRRRTERLLLRLALLLQPQLAHHDPLPHLQAGGQCGGVAVWRCGDVACL
eukprot:scaffold8123_cov66-Phaeocystis_antarctica.AAC.2